MFGAQPRMKARARLICFTKIPTVTGSDYRAESIQIIKVALCSLVSLEMSVLDPEEESQEEIAKMTEEVLVRSFVELARIPTQALCR